jgi:hypothetical protein
MQVENIECQIAQAQIGNFLAGSGLSDEAMVQLEEHIASCPTCKTALAAKREELRSMLKPKQAVVDFQAIHEEAEQVQAKSIASALRKRSLQKLIEPIERPVEPTAQALAATPSSAPTTPANVKVQSPAKSSSYWKPLAYSLGLGAVLVGMSLFSNNLASVFGPRASEVPAKNVPSAVSTSSITNTAPTANPIPETTGSTPALGTSTNTASTPGVPSDETAPSTPGEPTSTTGNSLGATTGALATTQFEASESQTQAPSQHVQQPSTPAKAATTPKPNAPAKPVLNSTLPSNSASKLIIRRTAKAHRPAVRRRHAPGAGIRIYQP